MLFRSATDQGVTDTEIAVGTMADPGNTIIPGLNQELFDAADAFVGWCNDAGGILGRKIVLNKRDAKLMEAAPRTVEACQSDFMLVGNGAALDDTTVKARTGVPASALAWAIAYDTGSAPRVSPPTASGDHPASRTAASPKGPMVASPSGLMVVSRQSMYSVDCRPEARVKLPRFAERSASIESRRSVGVMTAEVRRA